MANKGGRANGGFNPGGNGGGFNPGQPDARFAAEQGNQNLNVVGASFQLGKDIPAQNQRMSIPQTQFLRPQEMAKGSPRGAQAIPIVGMMPTQGQGGGLRLGSSGATTPAPNAPRLQQSAFNRSGAPVLPQRPPSPALAGPALGQNEEVHRIQVLGLGPDGIQEHVATFDAIFPRGTTMKGASEIPIE